MTVPLLDLKAQYAGIRSEIEAAVAEVFESQYFIGGPNVEACEQAVAAYSTCDHGVGVSSGTDALLIALMAEGIGPGDEVITSTYTFFATGGSIARTGARPVFVDIDPVTYNLDPKCVEARLTSSTKAIIPVHLYGQMADMDAIMEVAHARALVVIEDAAQAIGAESHGKRAGSIGRYGCFSFFPSKNLGGAGDGGMVVTNDAERAATLRRLRNHGSEPKYYHGVVGGNFRLDALQAAVISVKLRYLDAWTAARQANAERYDRLFKQTGVPCVDSSHLAKADPGDAGLLVLPSKMAGRHIFNQYVIRVPRREALRGYLKEHNIGNEVYYPVPLHLQECFGYLGGKAGDCPHAERAAAETLALPVYPELRDEQAQEVVEAIASFLTS